MLDFGAWLQNTDGIVLAIAVLLPVSASLVVVQRNPYQALVMRGILGAVAALVYALLGAADVALTEALVGTMLSITLYAVAVRSSLTLRVGILPPLDQASQSLPPDVHQAISAAIAPYHLRLQIVPCPLDSEAVSPQQSPQVIFDPAAPALLTPIERLAEIFSATIPSSQLKVVLTPINPIPSPQEVSR
ncbi:hydrogenase subunit MbhD domain-containing protein [Synechocystis salina]|uniref:DUF4040 domain-containing protein n=1 Tax=Synechocystis salina LEGE 00031 TaxID=1828736 RepID=A0ABR9VN43_9SYNC|nr:hydrogenase subunit MbhD domain-containing protein [Synechocystis salina]MBE9241292.1 DUF4040 domain-containing protein [Synechocystis salina LEGE 00041]MBE9252764.1 DUF4040 domain-containing protein [Synechocystis salina LEGE 00031]